MDSKSPPAQRPTAPSVQVTPDITIQPPLSRRGVGPGLVLVVSAALDLRGHEKTLDPPPLKKWAEEGYAVAQILVHDGASNMADQLGIAIAELEKLPERFGNKFGLVGKGYLRMTAPLSHLQGMLTASKPLKRYMRPHPVPPRSLMPSELTQTSWPQSCMGTA